jgi:2-amino-4-hydroxy-6-hydroxymethyldihydropteridine diphosphokinase
MCVAAIALGSNMSSRWGDRAATLYEAIKRVKALGEVRAVSSFHDTAPIENTNQPRFLNGAMLIETELEPVELMHGLLAIEQAMGRDRSRVPAKGPRAIDLDLLLMDGIAVTTNELTLPHPAMAERRFVLEPLAEIAPAMVDPISGKTVKEMLASVCAE